MHLSLSQSDQKYLSAGPFHIPELFNSDFINAMQPYLQEGLPYQRKKKEILIDAGKPLEKIIYLNKGIAYDSIYNKNGLEKNFLFFPGNPIGLLCIAHHQPVMFNVTALTNIDAYIFTLEQFMSFMQSDTKLMQSVLRLLSFEYRANAFLHTQYLTSSSFQVVCQTLYCLHLLQKNYPPAHNLYMSQQKVASLAGVHRSSVIRTYSELKDRGIIDFNNRDLLITDLCGLKELAFDLL